MQHAQVLDAMWEVLADYPIARQTARHGAHSVHRALLRVRDGCEAWLADAACEPSALDLWRVKASTGRGARWANVCWVSAMRQDETQTARDGRYIAWLWDAHGSCVVMAIVWGTAVCRRETTRGDVAQVLRERRARHASWLREACRGRADFRVDEDVSLSASTQLARDYERSCLVWREYDTRGSLEDIYGDFVELVKLYEGLIESAEETSS